jgi:membrane protease YdiL (CAAX protease family)
MLAASAYFIMRLIEVLLASVALPLHYQEIQRASVIQPVWLRASEPWVMLIALVIGAPVSEELLFRGFLLSALAKSRTGFWGAAVISNTAWTLTHLPWSWAPNFIIFVFGLLLSFILSRTGSVWPCVLAHCIANATPAVYRVVISLR